MSSYLITGINGRKVRITETEKRIQYQVYVNRVPMESFCYGEDEKMKRFVQKEIAKGNHVSIEYANGY